MSQQISDRKKWDEMKNEIDISGWIAVVRASKKKYIKIDSQKKRRTIIS